MGKRGNSIADSSKNYSLARRITLSYVFTDYSCSIDKMVFSGTSVYSYTFSYNKGKIYYFLEILVELSFWKGKVL